MRMGAQKHVWNLSLIFKLAAVLPMVAVLAMSTGCSSGSGGDTQTRVIPKPTGNDDVFDPLKPEGPREGEQLGPVSPEIPRQAYNDGDIAAFGNQKARNVVQTYFGKPYNRPDLEAVLTASTESTVEYVRQLGVALYKVPHSADDHRGEYFSPLQLPPTELDGIWKKGSDSIKEGQLEGLYFNACSFVSCLGGSNFRPTILVNDSGDRWTLVHEMMHHLFDKQRRALGLPNAMDLIPELKTHLKSLNDALDQYEYSHDRADFADATQALTDVLRTIYRITVVKDFEEISVENTLVDDWAYRRLQAVPTAAAYNALWYMNYSRKNGLKLLDDEDLNGLMKKMRQEAFDKGWTTQMDRMSKNLLFIENVHQVTADLIHRVERMTNKQFKQGEVAPLVNLAAQVGLPGHAHTDALGQPVRGCAEPAIDLKEWKKTTRALNKAANF